MSGALYATKNRRAIPEVSETSARRAFRNIVTVAIATATIASATQAATHSRGFTISCDATTDVTTAVMPMANPPQPGIEVNAVARSIVSRIVRMLLSA